MTVIPFPLKLVRSENSISFSQRFRQMMGSRKLRFAVFLLLLTVIGFVNLYNFNGYPGRFNDDEGTYMNQAWSMVEWGKMANYTYWYDHPFYGWAQLVPSLVIADVLNINVPVVTIGRVCMVIFTVAACAFMYKFARRIHMLPVFAGMAVVLFALTPLAIMFHRMVFLDNIAVMWLLAAMMFAASPKKHVGAVFASAVCMLIAVLSKETVGVMLPVVIWIVLQHTEKRAKVWYVPGFLITFFGGGFLGYVLFAILKGELFPASEDGPEHVSLLWAFWWQLFGRESSGSLFDPSSGTFALAKGWFDADPWLLVPGLLLAPIAIAIRRLRPLGVAMAIQVGMLLRGGYVPQMYVIAVLPFAALVFAGVADSLYKSNIAARLKKFQPKRVMPQFLVRRAGPLAMTIVIMLMGWFAAPHYADRLQEQMTADLSGPSRQGTEWIIRNVPKDAVIIVDHYIWADLKNAGFKHPVWYWKIGPDKEINEKYFPNGYIGADYVATGDLAGSTLKSLPMVAQATEHSTDVVTFGGREFVIRKVDK